MANQLHYVKATYLQDGKVVDSSVTAYDAAEMPECFSGSEMRNLKSGKTVERHRAGYVVRFVDLEAFHAAHS